MNRIKFLLFFAIVFQFAVIQTIAAPSAKATQLIKHRQWSFMENKGQLKSKEGNLCPEIKYYGQSDKEGVRIYCLAGKISFVFTKTEKGPTTVSEATGTPEINPFEKYDLLNQNKGKPEIKSTTISTSRTDLVFVNSNPDTRITGSDKKSYFENYYTTGDANKGITQVHSFGMITYTNLYKNIDMVLYSSDHGLEYSFIVHPGGDVNDIKVRWNGIDNFMNKGSEGIVFCNALGTIKQSNPESFSEGRTISSQMIHSGTDYSFKVERYNHHSDLIIDPKLVWATYFGGTADDEARSITLDASGNIYMSGTTFSQGIATSGAYQTTEMGGQYYGDALLVKFSYSGKLLWATYYGGTGEEIANTVKVDASGKVYISGYTKSSSGIATSGAFQTSYGGDYDAFLAQFNGSGSLVWSTYYGGSSVEEVFKMSLDKSGNIYLTGYTGSDSNIATAGAFLTNNVAGTRAFLSKFNSSGNLVWGTYYGGSSLNESFSVCCDGDDNVYITGITFSSTDIATTGSYQSSYGGSQDAFVAKFNSSGNRIWGTYFGGTSGEQSFDIASDGADAIYLAGYTLSKNGIATSGAWQTSYVGSFQTFLARFNTSGSLDWSTYYGGGYDEAAGVFVDIAGEINMVGFSKTTTQIATTGAYQTSYSGGYDGYLARFNKSGNLDWGSYYGGSGDELILNVTGDPSGNIYFAGYTSSKSAIATSGAYQTSYGGGTYDAFLAKFSFGYKNDAGISRIYSPQGNFCAKFDTIKVRLNNYGSDTLTSVYIGFNSKTALSPYHWTGKLAPDSSVEVVFGTYNFSSLGSYKVSVYTYSPNGVTDSVPSNDTAIVLDTVYGAPSIVTGGNKVICQGSSVILGGTAVSGNSYLWSSIPAGFSSTVSNPSVNPTDSTVYNLTETTQQGCSASGKAIISISKILPANAGTDETICSGTYVTIGATALSGINYSWASIPTGFTSTSSKPYVHPDATTIYILTETNKAGCSKSDSVIIKTLPLPKAIAGLSKIICDGDEDTLGAKADIGSQYSWVSSPSGFSSTVANPVVKPTSLKTIYIVTETSNMGCSKTDSATLTLSPLPQPNAGTASSICNGSSVAIGSKAINGNTYNWTSNPKGFFSNAANPSVSPGSTTEYYLTETNINHCSAIDSVKITVYPLPDADWKASINKCEVTFSPDVPTNTSYFWHFGDGDSSDIYNPVYDYTSKGSFHISLITTNQYHCKSEVDSVITINELCTNGINSETSPVTSLNIYPNPFNTSTTIQYTLSKPSRIRIILFDIAGKQVGIVEDKDQNKGSYNLELNAENYHLIAGVYLLKILTDDGIRCNRIVKF